MRSCRSLAVNFQLNGLAVWLYRSTKPSRVAESCPRLAKSLGVTTFFWMTEKKISIWFSQSIPAGACSSCCKSNDSRHDQLLSAEHTDHGPHVVQAPEVLFHLQRCSLSIPGAQAMRAAVACAWIIPSSIRLPRPPETGLAPAARRLVSLTPGRRAAAAG